MRRRQSRDLLVSRRRNRRQPDVLDAELQRHDDAVQQRAVQRHRRVQNTDDDLVRRLRMRRQRVSDELLLRRQQLRAGRLLLRLVLHPDAVQWPGVHARAAVHERLLRRRVLLQRRVQRQVHALRRDAGDVHPHGKRHRAGQRSIGLRHRQPLRRNVRRQWQLWQFPDDQLSQRAVHGRQQLHQGGGLRRRRQLPAANDRRLRQRALLLRWLLRAAGRRLSVMKARTGITHARAP